MVCYDACEKYMKLLKNDTQNVPQSDPQDDTQGDTQKTLDKKIFNMIKVNKNVTIKEIATALNTSIITIKRHLKNIKNVKYVGSSYSGYWEIR